MSRWMFLSSNCTLAELQIECSERLVEQQHPRHVDERPRERDTLLLAARQLPGLRPPYPTRPDDPEHLLDLPLQLGAASFPLRWSPNATFSKIVRCGNSA